MSKNADQLQEQLESVTGVQLAQGIGHQPARGFWTEAWAQVFRRPAAVFGLVWIAIVSFFAIFSPLIASGHPLMAWKINDAGERGAFHSPLIDTLSSADITLIMFGVMTPLILIVKLPKLDYSKKLRIIIAGAIQMGLAVIVAKLVEGYFTQRDAVGFAASWGQSEYFKSVSTIVIGAVTMIPFILISIFVHSSFSRVINVVIIAALTSGVIYWKWSPELNNYDYRTQESVGQLDASYTIVPFSPDQSYSAMFNRPPGSTPMHSMWDRLEQWQRRQVDQSAIFSDEELSAIEISDPVFAELDSMSSSYDSLTSEPIEVAIQSLRDRVSTGELGTMLDLRAAIIEYDAPSHIIGTDTLGQDVLSQMLHACRLAISIGFVSTSIAVFIGVTIGSLMGYFGGWVDLILYRVVEIFMAIPVLFLLIVAAAVLPRNTYVMMAIIGCFTWTGAARFIRAEFMKLRETDYVQAAKAMGLPLWSILFKHMLPNGVTPVLVESSFLIAAAILIEAILSFLGLGPSGQASWGNLLRNASGETGDFIWWLAIFPGAAIFLTTLAYNLIGEALRDAIDPKLKKARV